MTVPFEFGPFGTVTVEGTEAPVIHLILNEPLGVLVGYGYGLATVYAYKYMLAFDSGFLKIDYDGYITPNLAALTNITNYGVLILIMMASRVIVLMKIGVRGYDDYSKFFVIFFLTICGLTFSFWKRTSRC